jgi:hypothetical protein
MTLLIAFQGATIASAHAIELQDLEQIMRRDESTEIRFTETRESPWLDNARVSDGVFLQRPGMLEKRVLEPRVERWIMHRDRMVWDTDGAIKTREIYFAEAPQLAVLASAIRGIVTGDIHDLGLLFDIELSGTRHAWSMTLQPRDAKLAGALESIVSTGNATGLETFVIHERNGQRTTTRLLGDE